MTTEKEFQDLAQDAISLFDRIARGFEASSTLIEDPTERMRVGIMYSLYDEIYRSLMHKRFDLERARLGTYTPGDSK
jgi:hypothetical protein